MIVWKGWPEDRIIRDLRIDPLNIEQRYQQGKAMLAVTASAKRLFDELAARLLTPRQRLDLLGRRIEAAKAKHGLTPGKMVMHRALDGFTARLPAMTPAERRAVAPAMDQLRIAIREWKTLEPRQAKGRRF